MGCFSVLATVATITLITSASQLLSTIRSRSAWNSQSLKWIPRQPIKTTTERHDGDLEDVRKERNKSDAEDLKAIKQLYYQLHNLERFPEILRPAKRLLLALLKETSAAAQALPHEDSIIAIESFSREALAEFQHKRDKDIGKRWEQYNDRRNEGGSRELFQDRNEAIWWLKQLAPVKYVDGAWLGHIGKVTTPFALQKTVKGAWQILSEELGDGDLGKNHVHVYHELLESISPSLPTAEMLEFGDPRYQLNDISVWKAGIAQLLVSLFPHEFLPEILGFNLHFEAISMDTLKACRELKEVGIDPYYFILHISIDNAHSGHSAIAIEIVCEYMDQIYRTEGEAAAKIAWKKIQAGYLLSSGLPGTTVCPSKRRPTDEVSLSHVEKKVMRIFKAKAQVVHGIHCCSKIRIGSRSVTDWLNPAALEADRWQMGLLDALSYSKYWIRRGDSNNSRFMRELQWNGRMFGSFTQDEYNVLKGWVDNLPSICLALEDSNAQIDDTEDEDILSGYPSFQSASTILFEWPASSNPTTTLSSFQDMPSLEVRDRPVFEVFLPLWLSHPCLLQGFVTVPFRTRSEFACTIVKILRAQGGFDVEQECVAGMCEVRRPNSLGLVGIGINMMTQNGLSISKLPTLKHVLHVWPSEFAIQMLQISTRPIEYRGLLIGMATAFAKMHDAMAMSQISFLSRSDQEILRKIAHRELEGLEFCWKELKSDGKMYAECCKGYLAAGHEIKKCFSL